jgi:Ni,Fe-hydrogenase III large subunit/Ni,Fe-hydrogenase III component G
MIDMNSDFSLRSMKQVRSNLTCTSAAVGAVCWRQSCEEIYKTGGRFLTLWGADDRDRDGFFRICAVFLLSEGKVLLLEHEMERGVHPTYPSLADLFPAASRMERATYDLLGIASTEQDKRGWLRHGGWPETVFPLRRDTDGKKQYPLRSEPYPFVQVEGDGVHEIAVGPVHAGTIEPGHFRFSVVGEKVLRLEERFGYTHKGVAKRFEEMLQQDAHRLAARLSGDSAVAFSWAYCAALESITQTACTPRAANLRGLALEHERLANHLGDLGALGNDAGFAFGLTQFSSLKEDLLRTNAVVFGARYLLDYILPGGVSSDLPENARGLLMTQYLDLEESVTELRSIYDEHAGLQDRFRDAGRLTREQAEALGVIGLVGRASGVGCDLRVDHSWQPYSELSPKLVIQTSGDVAARVQVRFDEIFESLRLCRTLLGNIPSGSIANIVPIAEPNCLGLGFIEGWRGPVLIALESGPGQSIRRCHAHDPSWQNWPLLEYAILGNIVPDFPLINKSFNLSYSGQDG